MYCDKITVKFSKPCRENVSFTHDKLSDNGGFSLHYILNK